MIRINLLPPEFRRRRSGPTINPPILILAAGLLICAGLGGFWGWVNYDLIPEAKQYAKKLDREISKLEARVAKVQKERQEIARIKAKMDKLDELIKRKVEWAETLWDFADLIGRDVHWDEPGFKVCCKSLTVTAAGRSGRSRSAGQVMNFQWQVQLVGNDREKAGQYLNAFWRGVATSEFWTEHNFQEQPEASYNGDVPKWEPSIEKVVVQTPLRFERLHDPDAETDKKGGA